MGAALLKNPNKLVAILTALVDEVGRPNKVPISVKIRILDNREDTLELVRRLCMTGIVRVTVHCRTTPMRPREPAVRDQLADIVKVCHKAGVQCYANGDVQSRKHADQIIQEFGVDGCMIARAAEENPSCFRSEGILPWREVAVEYLKTAADLGHYFSNTKFCLSHLIPGKNPLYAEVTKSKTVEALCKLLDVPYAALAVATGRDTSAPIISRAIERAKQKSETVRAAGGGGSTRANSGKKLSERGVTAGPTAAIDLPREQAVSKPMAATV